ncbi:MAG: hypothetical protein JRH18_18785 [Deltaproteobacteria bacterium]|nr:hypothetical protein [Deltaproteobacteria bacterium]MBW2153701.1 hypothetical protein [Deltaproteobacteria bacterium]
MNEKNKVKQDLEWRFNFIKQRYGDRLKPEELKELKKVADSLEKMTASLRAVELKNNDEPFTRFIPYEGET